MPFVLSLAKTGATTPLTVTLNAGDILFVLGANGTGKSSLMYSFHRQHPNHAERITAHRQSWMHSNAVAVTPKQRAEQEDWFKNLFQQSASRWKDEAAQNRTDAAIFDLVNAENERAREIQRAADKGDLSLVQTLAAKEGPFKVINEILKLSNISITLSVGAGETVNASAGGSSYSVAELSDGERNALLIATEILTAKPGTLMLIDEPERHLHRSIISPLLTQLFTRRTDCVFVISTHETMLPIDNPTAQTLLVRGCTYGANSVVKSWNADLLPAGLDLDEQIVRDILGSRRRILFVEGTEKSLDKSLYALIFPNVSIVAKESCREVEHVVGALRDATAVNWVRAFGIVDNDTRTAADIAMLKTKGVYAVSVFSVESIYYDGAIFARIAERQSAVDGVDAKSRIIGAQSAAIAAIAPHTLRLSRRAVEKDLRDRILRKLPGQPEIASGGHIIIDEDIDAIVSAEQGRLNGFIVAGDLSAIIARYPIRETPALAEITSKLGFANRRVYESAVRKLIADDAPTAAYVRSLFGTLESDLAAE